MTSRIKDAGLDPVKVREIGAPPLANLDLDPDPVANAHEEAQQEAAELGDTLATHGEDEASGAYAAFVAMQMQMKWTRVTRSRSKLLSLWE